MRVLGIATGVDSGAALVEEGQILAAVNEERLSRMKLVEGFPRASIREVLSIAGHSMDDVDAVLVGATEEPLVDELRSFDGWFESEQERMAGFLKRIAGKVARYREEFPILEKAYYALQAPIFHRRRRAIPRILYEEFGFDGPVRFVDHHLAHIASARFTSGFEDALVVSLDGGGDGKSGRVYSARGDRLREVFSISAYHSLGNYYAYVTRLCGFRAQKHEGKITGLAARGTPRYVNLLREFIDEEEGTFVNHGQVAFWEAVRELDRRLPVGWDRADLAASIQHHFEEVVRRFLTHWLERTGHRNVALAGGVFANVRVNQEVHELPGVGRTFVHPGMTDGGLAVGAALAACIPGILSETMEPSLEPLPHVYFGPDLPAGEVAGALRDADLSPEPCRGSVEAEVARLLSEGRVVARATGRMEYGPRALGHRSILYQPTDPSVNDWLNARLDRTEFMPFAPAVLEEQANRCFRGLAGAEDTARYMTMTFDCTDWMAREMPGVVHVDRTARPQLVSRGQSPGFHEILREYRARTGLPGVINTSFNRHEEPIVCSAEDCVRAFLEAGLDHLQIGDVLVEHPARPWEERLRGRASTAETPG